MRRFVLLMALLWLAATPQQSQGAEQIKVYDVESGGLVMTEKVARTDAEWKARLTPEQFHVLREKGTEKQYAGTLWNNHEHGIYRCAGCGLDLFRSEEKYDSGTGWPSFYAPVAKENVRFAEDNSFFMRRTEVLCSRCDGHLGHVFSDGPAPSGQRYCMNAAALTFVKAD